MALDQDIIAYAEGRISAGDVLERIRRSRANGHFSLSYGQQGNWADIKVSPRSGKFNIPWCFRISARFEAEAFRAAATRLIEQHGALRTAFDEEAGRPYQRLDPVAAPDIEFINARAMTEMDLVATVADLARRSFDLSRGRPIRFHVFERREDEWVLLLVAHHLVIDGQSAPGLLSELFALYAAFCDGKVPAAAPAGAGYREFVAWERAYLEGQECRGDLEYWRERLKRPRAVLSLPRRQDASGGGQSVVRRLSGDAAGGLVDLAQKHGVTRSVVFLGLLKVLLYRVCSEPDISVGLALSHRPDRKFERTIGYFVNLIASRSGISGDTRLKHLFAAERDALAEDLDHSRIPFYRLVQELRAERSANGNPLFQAAYSYVSSSMSGSDADSRTFGGVRVEPLELVHEQASTDFLLEVIDRRKEFMLRFECDWSQFDPHIIEKLAESYLVMLDYAVEHPDCLIADLPLLNGFQQQALLEGGRCAQPPGETEAAGYETLVELFERVAAAQPDAIAVVCEGRCVSYADLNERANKLAWFLRGQNVGLETPVALCAVRGVELVAGLLAVMKAGGVYVPLEPGSPKARLTAMLQEIRPAVLLTAGQSLGEVGAGANVVDLDADQARWAGCSGQNLPRDYVGLRGSNLAYIIHTSGSTGQPKAVAIEHRQISAVLAVLRQSYGTDRSDRVLQFAALSFDVSMEEIFVALTSGAALVLRDDGWITDARTFCLRISEHEVSIIHMTAGLWARYLCDPDIPLPRQLRLVVIGGEQAERHALEAWFSRPGARPRLVNQYGVTEATIASSALEVDGTDAACLSIGRPYRGVRVYITDRDGQLMPPELEGEMCIGGIGVGRGYLNQAGASAAKFVKDPFSTSPSARLYRTGDIACWNERGEIEYLGRRDSQVKIRGLRVDLGEICCGLRKNPDIRDAAVILREDTPGARRIAAYVVFAAPLSRDEVRSHLRDFLPEHMLPDDVVAVDALPFTESGKLDRAALPKPVAQLRDSGHVVAETPLESALAGIFAEVLKLDSIGTDEGFFDLGGDSLMAAQVLARVRQTVGVDLPLAAMFEAQSVAALSLQILAQLEAAADTSTAANAGVG
jgi:amino acid adenylation domain-containing protein